MVGLKSRFNQEQLRIFDEAGIGLSDEKKYSDDEIFHFENIISDYFSLHGLGDKDTVNNIGRICESIMDIFSEI